MGPNRTLLPETEQPAPQPAPEAVPQPVPEAVPAPEPHTPPEPAPTVPEPAPEASAKPAGEVKRRGPGRPRNVPRAGEEHMTRLSVDLPWKDHASLDDFTRSMARRWRRPSSKVPIGLTARMSIDIVLADPELKKLLQQRVGEYLGLEHPKGGE